MKNYFRPGGRGKKWDKGLVYERLGGVLDKESQDRGQEDLRLNSRPASTSRSPVYLLLPLEVSGAGEKEADSEGQWRGKHLGRVCFALQSELR